MQLIQRALCVASLLYTFAIVGNLVLTWFPVGEESSWSGISSLTLGLTEPLLSLLRGRVPPVSLGEAQIDTSFFIFFFLFGVLVPVVLGCSHLY